MDRTYVYLGIGAVALLVVAAVAFSQPGHETEIYVLEAGVSQPGGENLTLGLATTDDPIQFGVLPPEGVISERAVALSNDGGGTVSIELEVRGNISPHVSHADSMSLEPGERRNLTLEFSPENASEGYYRGELVVRRNRVG